MRLLHTEELRIQEFQDDDIPPYTILSHTWGDGEISFQEMTAPNMHFPNDHRIKKACKVAVSERYKGKLGKPGERYEWIWIDTCCIDKSSSAELTEAINSMYDWYQKAQVCYVYLVDLKPEDPPGSFQDCRWFKRGWTLQELIAPREMLFFDNEWNLVGSKADSDRDFVNKISEITRISTDILLDPELVSTISVAQRMSWASGRETTRVEDRAYCLLGIFGVHLSLIYGERDKAFRRLQEAIISSVPDLSIFAWRRQPSSNPGLASSQRDYCGFLATGPEDFAKSGAFIRRRSSGRPELSSLNGSILAKIQLLIEPIKGGGYRYLLPLDCFEESRPGITLCVRLRKCGYSEFVREDPCVIAKFNLSPLSPIVPSNRYLLPDLTAQEWAATRTNTPGYRDGTQNLDSISQSRSHAIHFKLPETMWIHMLDVRPAHRFDGEDMVFHLTGENNAGHDACMVRLRGGTISELGERIDVNVEFVFLAVGWSSKDKNKPPQCSLVDYSSIASVLPEFRNEACGWDFQRHYILERLVFHGIPRTSSIVTQGRKSRVRASFELSEPLADRRICGGDFWRASFSYEVCDETDDGQAVAEQWVIEGA